MKRVGRGGEAITEGLRMTTDQYSLTHRFITAVKDAADIESVASAYGRLTIHETRTLATCPCHNDIAPSLSLNADKQVCKCWLCLASGDVFWLVMQHEQVCFRDAVLLLARQLGLDEPPGLTWSAGQTRLQQQPLRV